MGGSGSGRYSGSAAAKYEDHHAIDLAWLRRRKMLVPGRSSSLSWSRGGERRGSIGVVAFEHGVRLIYQTRPWNGEPRAVDELIPFVWTTSRFGGRRQWFKCLSCGGRCRVLYGRALFRCRRCHRLKYESQYEASYSRATSRAQRIRMRLGGSPSLDEPFPPKPKFMQWKTYWRLEALDDELQNQWAAGMINWLGRLTRK